MATCDYCGLPMADWSGTAGAANAAAPRYCCFGCRFAASVTREPESSEHAAGMLTRLGLSVFCTLNVVAFSMALWTDGLSHAEAGNHLQPVLESLFRYVCLVFALPPLFLLGQPLLEGAIENLQHGRFSSDLLLAAGVAAAYGYSTWSVMRESGAIYFEVGCVILVLVTLGRWLEATARLKATAALDELQKLLPEFVLRLTPRDTEERIPLAALQLADIVRVLAGDRIPCDGILRSNSTTVDQQWLTGESTPLPRTPGDPVIGGTLNLEGDILVEVTQPPGSGVFARLIECVRTARATRGHHQRLADRLSAWFFPAMSLVAVGAGLWHGLHRGPEAGWLAAMSVVLIACPCALGLAAPMAVWTALGEAARRGVLFRNGEALERLAGMKLIRFDKTGTLTQGRACVLEFHVAIESDRRYVLSLAAGLARASSHTYSRSILTYSDHHLAQRFEEVLDIRCRPGLGVMGRLEDGSAACLGRTQYLADGGFRCDQSMEQWIAESIAAGRPVTLVGNGGLVCGAFAFTEEVRDGAADVLQWFAREGHDPLILTGDHPLRGAALAAELGVPGRVMAGLLPEDKLAQIQRDRRRGTVAMVGDGINDAPALAASDIGVALGCGTDVTRDCAAVCLLGNDLTQLPWAVRLARQTVRAIRWNLFWAFAYNTVGVALACTGWLNPALAAALMTGSSLFVIANSLRLGRTLAEERNPASSSISPPPADPHAAAPRAAVRAPSPGRLPESAVRRG